MSFRLLVLFAFLAVLFVVDCKAVTKKEPIHDEPALPSENEVKEKEIEKEVEDEGEDNEDKNELYDNWYEKTSREYEDFQRKKEIVDLLLELATSLDNANKLIDIIHEETSSEEIFEVLDLLIENDYLKPEEAEELINYINMPISFPEKQEKEVVEALEPEEDEDEDEESSEEEEEKKEDDIDKKKFEKKSEENEESDEEKKKREVPEEEKRNMWDWDSVKSLPKAFPSYLKRHQSPLKSKEEA